MDQEPKFPKKITKITTDWDWEDTDAFFSSRFSKFKEIIQKEGLSLEKNTKFLEIGSGGGKFLDFSKQNGLNIVGVDARPRGNDRNSQIMARIEQLPFSDESFEAITSNGVFDVGVYDQYPEQMMKEVYRVLKTGGVYVAWEPRKIPSKGLSWIEGTEWPKVYKKV